MVLQTNTGPIAVLQENNAKLEVAVDTAESGASTLQADAVKSAELTKKLQNDLQRAEQYGDSLRNRLRELDLVQDAIRDSANLEGRMNGASAKLWRELEDVTGGDGDTPFNWLQSDSEPRSEDSNTDREDNSNHSSLNQTPDPVDTRVYVVTKDNYDAFVEEFTSNTVNLRM